MFILNLVSEKHMHFVIDGNLVVPFHIQGNPSGIYTQFNFVWHLPQGYSQPFTLWFSNSSLCR